MICEQIRFIIVDIYIYMLQVLVEAGLERSVK